MSALLPAAALFTLAGCYVSSGPGYVSRAPVVIVSDDYVYYPGYEVYYSNTRHSYFYRDGNRWVTRPEPPRRWSREAPSVHMEFHDTPERHHAEVVRSYPRTWQPAARPQSKAQDHRDDRKDKDHDDHH